MNIDENKILQTIISSYSECPRDVATTPQTNRVPAWFYVYSDGKNIFIEAGRTHMNNSKVKRTRLDKQNITDIYVKYCKYKIGSILRNETKIKCYFISYWFGIFEDLNLYTRKN